MSAQRLGREAVNAAEVEIATGKNLYILVCLAAFDIGFGEPLFDSEEFAFRLHNLEDCGIAVLERLAEVLRQFRYVRLGLREEHAVLLGLDVVEYKAFGL